MAVFRLVKSYLILITEKLTYVCGQYELCPTSGRQHYQGYLELSTPVSLNQLKTLLKDNEVHAERRLGSQSQAIEYTRKSSSAVPFTWEEKGIKKQQGNRTDLERAFQLIKEKKNNTTNNRRQPKHDKTHKSPRKIKILN